MNSAASTFLAAADAQSLPAAPVNDFQYLGDGSGWVNIAGRLFTTRNMGLTWTEITPETSAVIRGALFLDTQEGFIVLEEIVNGTLVSFSLGITGDGGASWQFRDLSSLSIYDPASMANNISLHFLDSATGWIVFKQATSSNFNLGTIFFTTNQGRTWATHSAPAGEPVVFINQSIGFMVGGPQLDQLFRTANSGKTWSAMDLGTDPVQSLQLPNFLMSTLGTTAVLTDLDDSTQLTYFQTTDLGLTWEQIDSRPFPHLPGHSPLSANVPGEILTIFAGELTRFWQTTSQVEQYPQFAAGLDFQHISFVDGQQGWGLARPANCDLQTAICTGSSDLYFTDDGGVSWVQILTPVVPIEIPEESGSPKSAFERPALLSHTSYLVGQGYDQCDISTRGNLQAWKTYSPLSAVNLYIGGATRGCYNDRLSLEFVEALSIQGWKFIPTWVGLQAACSDYSKTMNINPNTAYQQGRDNASDAVVHAAALGLGQPGTGAGTVIYYDLEAFDTNNTQCLKAAKSFINGWVERLHELDVMAGVYGSVCASGLSDFAALDNPPDVVWPAWWISNNYNSAITPDNLPCLGNTLWGDRQRILQYSIPHVENWGSTAMNVDLNTINGIVADISNYVGVPVNQLQNGSFENASLSPWAINADNTSCDWSLVGYPNSARSGDQYLAINKTTLQPECTGFSQPLPQSLINGSRYRFAIWARSSDPDTLRAISLKLTADGPAPTATIYPYSGITDEWVCLEVDHTINRTDHTGVTPSVLIDDMDGLDIYFDDAQLSLNTGKLCPTIPFPTGLSASNSADLDRIFLNWDLVPGASYYKVYRTTDEDPDLLLGRPTTNSYIDNTHAGLTSAVYSVKGCNAGGCSQSSEVDTGNIAAHYFDFFDGFEDGNINLWSSSVNSPADAWVCLEGAIDGLQGLCINAGLSASAYLIHDLGAPSNTQDISFKLDPNNIFLGTRVIVPLSLLDTARGTQPLALQMKQSGSVYLIQVVAQQADGTYKSSKWVVLPNRPTAILVSWHSTSGDYRSLASASMLDLYIDGSLVALISDLNTQSLTGDQIKFGGLLSSSGSGYSGTLYLDNFGLQGPLFLRPTAP